MIRAVESSGPSPFPLQPARFRAVAPPRQFNLNKNRTGMPVYAVNPVNFRELTFEARCLPMAVMALEVPGVPHWRAPKQNCQLHRKLDEHGNSKELEEDTDNEPTHT